MSLKGVGLGERRKDSFWLMVLEGSVSGQLVPRMKHHGGRAWQTKAAQDPGRSRNRIKLSKSVTYHLQVGLTA